MSFVVFWHSTRPKMPFKVMHRKEVTHSNGSYERKSRWQKLADEMGRGKKKSPWYTHRLMHRKRVTCELHDSYFRLMTIKHAISKIEEATEWSLNYYITQSRQKSSEFQLEIGRSYRRDVIRKATSGRRGLGSLLSWGPGKLVIRCSKESHHPAEWAPGWASGERERHNVDGHKSGGQNIAVSVRSPTPSHTQTLSNPFRTLTINWEVHIFIKKSSCVCLLFCRYDTVDDNITLFQRYWSKSEPDRKTVVRTRLLRRCSQAL